MVASISDSSSADDIIPSYRSSPMSAALSPLSVLGDEHARGGVTEFWASVYARRP